MNRERRLEVMIGEVLRLGTIASSTLFAIGLVMALAGAGTGLTSPILGSALVILMATPAARVTISTMEYVRQRDWVFVVLTVVVLAALGGSVLAAYYR
jgi:uncharacterized membrane protein